MVVKNHGRFMLFRCCRYKDGRKWLLYPLLAFLAYSHFYWIPLLLGKDSTVGMMMVSYYDDVWMKVPPQGSNRILWEANSSNLLATQSFPITVALVSTTSRSTMLSEDVTKKQKSRYAYAFLVAGCDPKKPSYRGFLYNILVAKYNLRTKGSTADVVVMLRMTMASTATRLPWEDEQMLTKAGIVYYYLPPLPMKRETFYSAMMAKFHVLNLTEYSRVIYMDADIMPLCNFDYLFHLSEKGILKENVILTWWFEPASGGFFMLKPEPNGLVRLQEILKQQQQQQQSRSKKWPPFDIVQGWGHEIEPQDPWRTLMKTQGTNWTFQFAFADQGLLYHWTKYVKRNVSIVYRREVQNWIQQQPNGSEVSLETVLINPFQNYTCPTTRWDHRIPFQLSKTIKSLRGVPLYHDFAHFTGKQKPWERKSRPGRKIPPDIKNWSEAEIPSQLWFHVLRRVRNELNLSSLDVDNLHLKSPSLGRYPTYHDMVL